jgi:triosephosphate isomerase
MIIAANFKTNLTREATAQYLEAIAPSTCDVRVFPPMSALMSSQTAAVGAQNFYPCESGAFTGEIGAAQLEEFGIRDVLIGHSERRVILGESQEFVARKFAYAASRGWRVIYCIGEPKAVRDEGFESVMEYLWSEFDGIDMSYSNFAVAYEPIWAIGTGVSAEASDIAQVLDALAMRLAPTPILYGGSVNTSNLAEILSLANCGGALIGGASLDAANFCKLIKIAEQAQK